MTSVERFVPGFEYEPAEGDFTILLLRNMLPAGVVIGRQRGETLDLLLDYAIPRFRDFKTGRYLYGRRSDLFTDRGITRLRVSGGSERHHAYLRGCGFTRTDKGDYERAVPP